MKPERMWDQYKFCSATYDARIFEDGVPDEILSEFRKLAIANLLKELDIADEETLEYEKSKETMYGDGSYPVWRHTFKMRGWKK